MSLDSYLQGLLRRWILVILLTAIGLLSAFAYFRISGKETARLTVAAIEPALTRATKGGVQAQITFDSVIQSQALAQRVINRLGLTGISAYDLSQNITAKLAPTLIPNVVTPLYVIEVKHKDPELAILIANTAAEEAQQMFLELNALDANEYRQIYESQLAEARAEVDRTMAAFEAFRRANGIYSLNEQISQQASILRQLVNQQQRELAAQRMNIAQEQARQANLEEIQRRREQAMQTLQELGVKEADYNLLFFELTLAEKLLNQVTAVETQLNLGETLVNYRSGVRGSLAGLGWIRTPADFTTVRGTVQIIGTAVDPNFWKYEVHVAPASQPSRWILLGVHESQVQEGVLETWDTTTVPDASYFIRLRVVRRDANYTESLVRQVWVDNSGQGRQDGLQVAAAQSGLFDGRGSDVAPATRPAIERAASWVSEAKKNLTSFQLRNDATALSSRIESQVNVVAELDQAERQALAEREKAQAAREAQDENLAAIEEALTEAQAELARLMTLQPEYERLQLELQLAQSALSQLDSSVRRRLLEETTLGRAQVKILDKAIVKPRFILTVAIYVVSGLMGFIIGLVLIYILTYFDRTVYTPSEAEALMDAPVLVTVPPG